MMMMKIFMMEIVTPKGIARIMTIFLIMTMKFVLLEKMDTIVISVRDVTDRIILTNVHGKMQNVVFVIKLGTLPGVAKVVIIYLL